MCGGKIYTGHELEKELFLSYFKKMLAQKQLKTSESVSAYDRALTYLGDRTRDRQTKKTQPMSFKNNDRVLGPKLPRNARAFIPIYLAGRAPVLSGKDS